MKVTVTREDGYVLDGKNHPQGIELELSGPLLDAALRFKEVEPVKEEKPDPKKK